MSRPRVLVVLGVLNLLFALVWVVKGLLMPLYAVVPLTLLQNNNQFGQDLRPVEALYAALEHPGFMTYWLAGHGLGVLAGLALGVGGVGLLMSRRWGRRLTVGWAWYALAAAGVTVWMEQLYVAPALASALEQPHAGTGQALAEVFIGLVVRWAYPVVLLVLLGRPHVLTALDRSADGRVSRAHAGAAVSSPTPGVTQTTTIMHGSAPSPAGPDAASRPPVAHDPPRPGPPAAEDPHAPDAPPPPVPAALQTWRDDPWNDPEAT